jgi:hypothetical protein
LTGGGEAVDLLVSPSSTTALAPKRSGITPTKRPLSPAVLVEPVEDAPYAKYGVVFWKLLHCKGGTRSCLVFCKGWPSWVWAALSRGFKVKLTIVNNILWKPLILKISPSTEVLLWSAGLTFQCPAVTAVFSDFDLSGRLSDVWNHVSELVILPRATRALVQGWKHFRLPMAMWILVESWMAHA